MKRTISIVLVLMTLTVFIPSAFPLTAHAAALAPELIAMGEVAGSGGIVAGEILALYEVIQAGLKSVGIEFVNIGNVSALIPNETLADNISKVIPPIYNALSAAEKAVVWAKAQAVAAGETIVSMTSSFVNTLKDLFKSQNPAQSETTVYDPDMDAYYTAYNQGGVKWIDLVEEHGTTVIYPDTAAPAPLTVFLAPPTFQYYELSGSSWVQKLFYAGSKDKYGHIIYAIGITQSGSIFLVFEIPGYADLFYQQGWYFGVDKYVSPPRSYADKSPLYPALPSVFYVNLPTFPTSGTPLENLGEMAAAVGGQTRDDLVTFPELPTITQQQRDYLNSLLGDIFGRRPVPPPNPDELGWTVTALIIAAIQDLLQRGKIIPANYDDIVDAVSGIDTALQNGTDPSGAINGAGELIPTIDPVTYPPGTFPYVPPAVLPTAPPTIPTAPPGGGEGTVPNDRIDWSPLQEGLGAISLLFPFCIPFDLAEIFSSFAAEAQVPVFDLKLSIKPVPIGNNRLRFDEVPLKIDLTPFSSFMPFFRGFLVLIFIIWLLNVTFKFIKW
ncbi:hypothetical protein FACS18949_13450 [Clostridia bacterium]|nr:hypothetical protein FACS18949_13450 [Clostridia bacterium]